MVPTLRRRTVGTRHLDRMTWAGGLTVDAYGVIVGLRASSASAVTELHRVIPPDARLSDAQAVDAMYSLAIAEDGDRIHHLYEDATCTARSDDLDELLLSLQSQLHFRVAVGARTHLFVHAGVVGWRGGAILVPGRSHSGKSSLVAALLRAGATYYSDEYAVLDDDGRVHPFARALGIRDSNGRSRQVPPRALGAAIGEVPLPVRLVVATRHVPGASWRPWSMSPGETALTLLENTLAARSRPAAALRILATAATGAVGLRGDRGDADGVAKQVLL